MNRYMDMFYFIHCSLRIICLEFFSMLNAEQLTVGHLYLIIN